MEGDNEKIEKTINKKAKSKTITGYILFALFGIGTWLNLNGIWIQLPLLIPRLSEGWSLSPQLGMASNIANVGPLLITLVRYLMNESSAYEVPSICAIFSVGILVPIALSFTWDRQVYFLGKTRSLYLLIFGFCLALVNCTSSVTYLPFVNRFDKKWLNIYFAGESLSSLIPAMIGLVQGVGEEAKCIPDPKRNGSLKEQFFPPRFSVEVYFRCLSVIMCISFVAFLLLWRQQKKQKQKKQLVLEEGHQLTKSNNEEIPIDKQMKKEEKFDGDMMIYLFITLWTSILLIGCIPSINSYSLNPYGAATFHYVIILCQCCYTFLSMISIIRPQLYQVSMKRILVLTFLGTFAFIYILITAFRSPCAPFVDSAIGKYLIGLMWLLVYLIFYYERIALGNYFNQESGHRGLFWYGFLTQAGAFTGAIFIYILSSLDVFQERALCEFYQYMIVEENNCPLVIHLILVGFHHKKGHQIEYSYPPLNDPIDEHWLNISSLALPDGVHNRDKDLIYFHLSSNENSTVFGIASYRQIDANSVVNKEADVTRNSIQKSVCLLLRQPVYGSVSEELEMLTEKYFTEKDFNERKLFDQFVDRLNINPPQFDLKYFSARDLVQQYRRKTLILFKLLLLQKKVLFMLSPIEHLVKTIVTLVSLIPDLVEKGLTECTILDETISNQFEESENEDIVFCRSDEQPINFDQIKLKTLKIDDDEISSTVSTEIDQENSNTMKTTLIKRATSITTKLSDTFNRLTTTTTNQLNENPEQDLTHLDQFHFPIEIFSKNNNLHPYLSIHSLDLISNGKLNSCLIGASNGLFRQQNQWDCILSDQEEDFLIQSIQLKNQLQLTTVDLRFTQLFEDQSGVKSEEEIRRLFVNYFLSLLAVARTPNEEAMNDFNCSYVKEFQCTNAFRSWLSKGPYPHFEQIIPKHPQSGQLNVTDVKLRVVHVLDDTETGRKLKGAFEDTSVFMGEKSRAATKALGQAKNSIFSSVVGTFNQGRQWLARSQSSNQ